MERGKRRITGLLALAVVLVVLVVAGCAAPAPTATPKPTAPSPSPTATPGTVAARLKVAHYFTATDSRGRIMAEWLRQVKEVTGGRVTGEVYPNGTLANGTQMFGATKDGLVDVGTVTVSYVQGEVPELGIFVIPPVSANFDKKVMECLIAVWDRMDKQFQKQGVKLLSAYRDAGKYSFFMKPQIKALTEMTGKKVRTAGGVEDTTVFKELGMIPVSMGAGEQYQALQTGVIDGCGTASSSYLEYKLYEVAPYIVWISFKFPPYLIFMDLDTWNKIPADLQAKISPLRDSTLKYAEELFNAETTAQLGECDKKAKGSFTPSDAEANAWMAKAMSVRKDWIKKVGDETANYYLDTFEKVTGAKWRP